MNPHSTSSMIRSISLCALMSLLPVLAGCNKPPPQASDIAGTWKIMEAEMSGTLALRPDASYVADTNSGKLEGTWKIQDDRLVGTVSKSTVPNISMGYSWTSKIDLLSDTELALANESGETENYRRVK